MGSSLGLLIDGVSLDISFIIFPLGAGLSLFMALSFDFGVGAHP